MDDNIKIVDVIRGSTKILKVYINKDNERLLNFSDVELIIKEKNKHLFKVVGILTKTIKNTYYYKFTISHDITCKLSQKLHRLVIRGKLNGETTYLEDKKDLKLYLQLRDSIY